VERIDPMKQVDETIKQTEIVIENIQRELEYIRVDVAPTVSLKYMSHLMDLL
jgi:hypothetical protein